MRMASPSRSEIAPCQLSAPPPSGVPTGNPSIGSARKAPAATNPTPPQTDQPRSPGSAPAGCQRPPHPDRSGDTHQASHDEGADLNPAQVAVGQQARRVPAQVEPVAGERLTDDADDADDVHRAGDHAVTQQTLRRTRGAVAGVVREAVGGGVNRVSWRCVLLGEDEFWRRSHAKDARARHGTPASPKLLTRDCLNRPRKHPVRTARCRAGSASGQLTGARRTGAPGRMDSPAGSRCPVVHRSGLPRRRDRDRARSP